ncbi:hypothetical protein BDU57DRAFT_523262 [Ampelomyces quisqualis]|uniref:MARVEL domain-containing protein n=1 Tax=Ampelomyces quisqualis TaxID=50730 RepID=A0A6A5QAZ1_AMPQU|nr:hypothetical protein BDU57DRAFT_523262 [Ampelomyces quisqualis]
MAFRRDRMKPTHYPRLPFHIVRSVQVLSSTVVASVMFYFLSALAQDNLKLPWTFILLMAVALLTLVSLAISIVLHCCHGLNPTLNMVLNAGLALLWAVAFSLLSWWASGTLSHVCNKGNWDDEVGVSVCRLYKALFSFSLFGLMSTILALILDAHVQRQALVRGKFEAIGMAPGDGKAGWSHVLESNPNPSAGRQQGRGGEGYFLPEEQFGYGEDTGYHGAAGQAERRSLERRV